MRPEANFVNKGAPKELRERENWMKMVSAQPNLRLEANFGAQI